MDMFNNVLQIVQKGVAAFGVFWIVWGLIVLGSGIKDKTAPDIKQGIGQIVGGAMIVSAALLIGQITM